jgi:4-amino-4-deoxy-L-arabinose transferase-like glycosyltransferase
MKEGLTLQIDLEQKIRGYWLLAAGIAIAAAAQWILMLSKDQPGFWDIGTWWKNLASNSSPLTGLILYAVGGLVFIKAINQNRNAQTFFNISTLEFQPDSPRFGFWVTSLCLGLLTACLAAINPGNEIAPIMTATWLISIALFILSVTMAQNQPAISAESLIAWIQAHRSDLIAITVIVTAAFLIRFEGVELHPYSFINDEGQMGKNGVCVISGQCQNLFTAGWSGQPMLAFLPTGISIAIFGRTVFAVRLVSVILGTLAVASTYLFTREVFGKTPAWMAAGLLASLPINVHFSRLGVDNIVDSLSTATILWLLFRGLKSGSVLNYLMAGILAGLCLATYPGTRLAPFLGFGCLFFAGLRNQGFIKAQKRNILIFILAFGITAAPFMGYFYTHPELFFVRINRESIFQNNIFQNELQAGKSAAEILTSQFLKSSLVFILTPAPSNFFNSPQPYLPPLAAVFFVLGMFYSMWRIKDERYITVFVWFWIVVILGSTLTGGPPTSQRLLMSTPALVIMTAIGFSKVIETLPQNIQNAGLVSKIIPIVFILFIGFQNIYFYFYEYRNGHFFEDRTNELTYETAPLIEAGSTNNRFYLIAEPGVPYLSFPNFSFFSPDVEKAYFNIVTPQTLAGLPNNKDALFIATANRKTDIEQLARFLPGGQWNQVNRRYQPSQVLFYSYKVKQSDLFAFKPSSK